MNFQFTLSGTPVVVQTEKEGEARYMVRMAKANGSFLRIGYLTGRGQNWLAEPGANQPSIPAESAKVACQKLAEAALAPRAKPKA